MIEPPNFVKPPPRPEPPVRYCINCDEPFRTQHHSKRFCTVMCQENWARKQKRARDKGEIAQGGDIEVRQQAILAAAQKIPRITPEGTVVPPIEAPQITPRSRPMEGDGSGVESFIDIARSAGIPVVGKKESEEDDPTKDPSFWEEGPEGG